MDRIATAFVLLVMAAGVVGLVWLVGGPQAIDAIWAGAQRVLWFGR